MEFHYCRLLFVLLSCLLGVASANAQPASLQVEASGEEASGIFWDSETLQTQTAPLLTIKIANQNSQACRVQLRWQVTDSSGQKRHQKSGDYNLEARSEIRIRDLFAVAQRGSYVLKAQVRRHGSEKWSYAAWPFAIVTKPQAGFRPQSFFILDTPLLLDETSLHFYARCGARVLRSKILDANNDVSLGVIDNQIRSRLARNLATLAVLDEVTRANSAIEASRTLPVLTRYAAVKTWELASSASVPSTSGTQKVSFDPSFLASARLARPDASWVWPLEIGDKVQTGSTDSGIDSGRAVIMTPLGLLTSVDQVPQAAIPGDVAHPEALRRALLATVGAARTAKTGLHIRAQLPQKADLYASPLAAADDMVSRYALSIMGGAASMSVPLIDGTSTASSQARYAQAAAFAQMTKMLEDATFVEDLFPRSPALCGALFQVGTNSIALIWPSRPGNTPATLQTRLLGARLLDVFGNALPSDNNLKVPLTGPVYILSNAAPSTVAWALRNGKVSGIAPVAARALPLTQMVSGGRGQISVRLQNVLLQPASGIVRLKAPPGWELKQNERKFTLGAGEIRDYNFSVSRTKISRDGLYPIVVALDVPGGSGAWQQDLRVACATSTQNSVRLDGDLGEWRRASWMEIRPSQAKIEAAKVALLWDENYLYVAAQIKEPHLRATLDATAFGRGDALQLAFGTRGEVKPDSGPFRDTDWSLILSAQAGGQVKMPGFALPREARCVARRDEQRNVTFYEAAVPLEALPDLKPSQRAVQAEPVRFGWILHNDEGAPLEWSAATSVFQWWRNPASFAPDSRLFLAAQMPLGFGREGVVNARAPRMAPATTPANGIEGGNASPRRTPKEPIRRNFPPGEGILAPMPPRLLPPVKESQGKPILPSAPNVSVSRVP
jgi:hypothetical protein